MKHRLMVAGALAVVLGACGGGGDGIGKAGDAAKAARTIEVRQLDTRRFDPAEIQVKPGETVTIRVTNTATGLHEFFLGDQKAQDDHEKEMSAMGSGEMKMADEGNRLFVEPGETKELTWTFPDKGSVEFGCHMPTHYAAGMEGEVTVSG